MPQCFADTSGSLSWMLHFRPLPIITSNAPRGNANPFKGPETPTILGFILREILVDQESSGKLEIRVRRYCPPEVKEPKRTSSCCKMRVLIPATGAVEAVPRFRIN